MNLTLNLNVKFDQIKPAKIIQKKISKMNMIRGPKIY